MAKDNSPRPEQAPAFGADVLSLDCAIEAERIKTFLAQTVSRRLHRRGVVIGLSGGIDSAVCASLAARALGPDRVLALMMPEKESSVLSTARAQALCARLGIPSLVEEISPALEGIGCYARRDAAIRVLVPQYAAGWRQKVAIAGGSAVQGRLVHFNLIVESPTGERLVRRMPASAFLQVVAATNFKQRFRKDLEYFHAERLNYAVLGTPNRLEYQLGFFVRGGDGLADLKPITHLYKSQVYALARYLEVPDEIRNAPPTTDTYSLPQGQDEFFFELPYNCVDLLLYAMDNRVPVPEVSRALGLDALQIESVYRDLAAKRRAAIRTSQDAIHLERDNHA